MNNRNIICITTLFFAFIITQSFRCNNGRYPNACTNYTNDSCYVNVSLPSTTLTVKLNDTIWLTSTVSDTITNKAGTDKFVTSFSNLYFSIQPYRVLQNTTLPQVAYANIEFNQVVKDGLLLPNSYYNGYQYQCRRSLPFNYLQAGLIPGKIGLYLLQFSHGTYPGSYQFFLNNPNDFCKSYSIYSALNANQQNKQYWDSLNVTTLTLQGNTNYTVASKSNTNYLFIKVVP